MRKTLKKYFLPHLHNNFLPHFFRTVAAAITAAALMGSFLLFTITIKSLSRSDSYAAIFVGALISYTNEARAETLKTQTLETSELLTRAAQLKANDMAEKGYFSHNTPDGKTPWYWFNQVGYQYQYAGENLAIDFVDSKDVTDAWLASPGHRANILNASYKEIGVATAVGLYQGRETTFVVQMFGTPTTAASVVQSVVEKAKTNALPANIPAESLVEEKVAGVQAENISAVELALASPKGSLVSLYALFIAIVAALMLFGAIYEFKRHHKGIWLSGGALISIALILIALTLQFGEGAMII